MHLRPGEVILQTIRRHKTPYVFSLTKIFLVALPLYAVLFVIGNELDVEWIIVLMGVLSFFVGIVITLISLDFLLDKLIITNKRVVWSNWKSLFKREEHEAELQDIQDIETREKGVLSRLKILDYGYLEIETASSKTCIAFQDCPNPEGVKHFIINNMERQRMSLHGKKNESESEEWSVN